MLLYPISIILIIFAVFTHFFKMSRTVYVISVLFTLVPAIMDMIVNMPAVVSKSSFGLAIAHVRNMLPLANEGLSWFIPMIVGLIIGTIVFKIQEKAK